MGYGPLLTPSLGMALQPYEVTKTALQETLEASADRWWFWSYACFFSAIIGVGLAAGAALS